MFLSQISFSASNIMSAYFLEGRMYLFCPGATVSLYCFSIASRVLPRLFISLFIRLSLAKAGLQLIKTAHDPRQEVK